MRKLTKNQKRALEIYDPAKTYSIEEASKIVKKITFSKFDSSVDLDIRLGVDPKKADQMVRGVVTLPNGVGKQVKVLVLCTPDKEEEAKAAGADYVGLDEYIKKIERLDRCRCHHNNAHSDGKSWSSRKSFRTEKFNANPKSGTVTMDIGKAVTDVKAGKIDFKVDKTGIIHAIIGKVSFEAEKISENVFKMLSTINKLKPASAKGAYFRSISLSSTMGSGISIDKSSIASN